MNSLKSLLDIWSKIANDLGATSRDVDSLKKRVASQGLPFLTIVMPRLGKAVDASLSSSILERGSMDITQGESREWYHDFRVGEHGYPLFLQDLFARIYTHGGVLKGDADEIAIRNLRQLLLVFYKYETPISDEDAAEGFRKFQTTDRLVKTSDWHWTLPIVRKHFSSLLPSDPFDLRCHHSNGQTAERVTNRRKREETRYIPSLHNTFSFGYFFHNSAHLEGRFTGFPVVTAEPSARIAFVPKDSRGARIICMEPHERMYVQKGLQTKLYEFTERYSPAKGRVNFTNQSINQRLAQLGSFDQRYATIDMKDASDLVSWPLIVELLRDEPEWLDALRASRSGTASYNDENVVMNKFAPMGSALCFPIEAFLFWAIIRPLTSEVWVFGDDIIVPNNLAEQVMNRLEEYGLVVNREKSLYKGYFRESCGGEYFHGHDIKYLRIKSFEPISYISFCNLYAERYGSKTADDLIALYEHSSSRVVARCHESYRDNPLPMVYYTNNIAASSVFFARRYNTDLQRYEFRMPTVKNRVEKFRLTGYNALFNWLTQTSSATSPEGEQLAQDFEIEGLFGTMYPTSPSIDLLVERQTNQWSLNTTIKFSWLPEMVVVQTPKGV